MVHIVMVSIMDPQGLIGRRWIAFMARLNTTVGTKKWELVAAEARGWPTTSPY